MRAPFIFSACFMLGNLLYVNALRAETHGITVLNRTGDTIRSIQIVPAGSTAPGENRLRSQLPPNAEARISYSTGCEVDLHLGFNSGRVEKRLGLDACNNSHVSAVDGAMATSGSGPVRAGGPVSKTSVSKTQATPTVPPIELAPAPPWNGRSITKRFGGLY